MNHFAHLVLARPTVESTVGNLLGDFARGVDIEALTPAVRAGLDNHRAVDRFTDTHPLVSAMKEAFSPARRRFAGIALDIYFDHLLIRYWDRFDARDPDEVIGEFYRRMLDGQALMPAANMRSTTRRMVETDWFGSYRHVDSVAQAIDRVAARIRFEHSFDNAIEDLRRNHEQIRDGFFEFFPALRRHIADLALE
ncbi:MAG: ACP phosphodiesterase [Gammaproteobacteria bacterium]|nr:ACP phosphodiesterase [Gammaproteobacteria bacterium]